MNPEQLWETTMDPEKRTLVQIRLEDAYAADEIFNILMGEEVEPRREYIQTHALKYKILIYKIRLTSSNFSTNPDKRF